MKITQDFKNAIKATFYDKTVDVLSSEDVTDSEGWATQSVGESVSTFNGNVRFDNLEKLQEDFGLIDKIDIAITTDEVVDVGSIIQYGGRKFKLTKAFPFDSHYLLVGQIWLSESQTLPSA